MKKNCILYHFFVDFVHCFTQFKIHFAQPGVKTRSIDDLLAKISSNFLISKLFHIIEAWKLGKNVIILLVKYNREAYWLTQTPFSAKFCNFQPWHSKQIWYLWEFQMQTRLGSVEWSKNIKFITIKWIWILHDHSVRIRQNC